MMVPLRILWVSLSWAFLLIILGQTSREFTMKVAWLNGCCNTWGSIPGYDLAIAILFVQRDT